MTEHDITPNTRAHWALYALSAFHEREGPGKGTTTRDLYEWAGGDSGVVFTSSTDVSAALSTLRDADLVQRRTARQTGWDDVDVEYEVRLSPAGRKVVSVLGKPTKLPERRNRDHDRTLPKEPTHEPDWYDEPDVEIDPAMLPNWLRTGEGEIVSEIQADLGSVEYEGVEEAVEALARQRLPNEGEMVEATNGAMVEFQRVDDSGKLVFHGPSETDDEDANVLYMADSPHEAPEKQTVDLSPEWDWLGVQLAKLGLDTLAIEAFRENLSPALVYGDILDVLHTAAWENECDLDFTSPVPDGLTLVEAPYDPEEAAHFKRKLGVED